MHSMTFVPCAQSVGWALAVVLSGCAGSVKHMQAVANVNTTLSSQEAAVVFIRPSTYGFPIQSSVFDVRTGQPMLLAGLVAAKKKLFYRTAPGPHLFMVMGESGDFLAANLAPGKTYYVVDAPRLGIAAARFSLRPLKTEEEALLPQWLAQTEWVVINAESSRWARENASEIQKKRAKYYPEWLSKPESTRPVLGPAGGR